MRILKWLEHEALRYPNIKFVSSQWKFLDLGRNRPQQNNAKDCGMFVVMNSDFISDNIPSRIPRMTSSF